MTAIHPEVTTALRHLAQDLKMIKRANMPMDWATVGRALDGYDARLARAGYEHTGPTVTKLADGDLLTKSAEITKLKERIDELENMAMPGGPSRMAVKQASPRIPTQADRYRAQAEQTNDPTLRRGYLQLAAKFDKDTQ